MRVRLVLPLVAVALAACGGSSTGPKPPVDTQTIEVSNTAFTPPTLSVVSNTKIIWHSTDGPHVIRFTGTVPSGSDPNSSTFGTGESISSVNTIFLTTGTYTYEDSLRLGHTGTITVHN
jgi:plastocyanin